MDHHKLLIALTTHDKQESKDFNESLQHILLKVQDLFPDDKQDEVRDLLIAHECEDTIRNRYLQTVLYVLKSLKNTDLSTSDTFLSLNQCKTVKAAIEIVVSIGILPCLFRGIGAGMYNTCKQAKKLDDENLTDLQKYHRLSMTIRDLVNCFDEVALRSILLHQLGALLGALLQLSYAPLVKPSSDISSLPPMETSSLKMTKEMYEKLTKDQNEFRQTLSTLIDKCPQAIVVKELMIILGMKNAPNWIRRRTQILLTDAIMRPNGIVALVDAMCGDIIDVGAHWNKLDIIARLVATSHGQNPDVYYEAVCSQLVKLLTSKNIKHSSSIANNCIMGLYEHNPNVCKDKIVRVIDAPLRVEKIECAKTVLTTETEVADCIDNLTNCFIPTDANFKHPPCILMKEIALPLFCLYAKARQSVSLIQTKLKNLLINLMINSPFNNDLWSAILEHDKVHDDFGTIIPCRFGPNGGLEIVSETEVYDHETAADSLFELVMNHETLAFDLFNYLLRSLSTLDRNGKTQILETTEDTFDRMEKKLATMRLLSKLAATRKIQEAQTKNPEPILSFVKSLFNERTKTKSVEELNSCEDESDNMEIIYVSLMLVKVILTDTEKPKDWKPFDELAKFLTNVREQTKMPEQLFVLVNELLKVIQNRGRSVSRRYHDLNMDDLKKESNFEKALKDLGDPLLPVRAHGLMSLTKLLETRDPETIAKKDIVLCFFQENLKDEDSFVYLSAVNGLCAIASLFPDKVIKTLVQEYIDMPQRNESGEITPETRMKLGEILVKTTRSLGEICPAYKNILINGFLCGTRDPDDMVRASSLSCLAELCKILGFGLGHAIHEVIYCIGCIIETDKAPECRRAAVLVATLLIRGLGKDVLTNLGNDLVRLYRALKFLRDNDDDHVLRLHAQVAVEELDDIVQTLLFTVPRLEKRLFLIP